MAAKAAALAVLLAVAAARGVVATADALSPQAGVRQMVGRWYEVEKWYWDGPSDDSCMVFDFSQDPGDPEDICLSIEAHRSAGSPGPIRACYNLNTTENRWVSKGGGSVTLVRLDREGDAHCTVRIEDSGGPWVAMITTEHPPRRQGAPYDALRHRQVTIDSSPPLQHVRPGNPALCPAP